METSRIRILQSGAVRLAKALSSSYKEPSNTIALSVARSSKAALAPAYLNDLAAEHHLRLKTSWTNMALLRDSDLLALSVKLVASRMKVFSFIWESVQI